ncbi:hypothetical protein [Niallia taxi]|uniref:hypothetical protein n=1 Tax=Niallia taxi TaxID=2499688 RepID=UPI0015F5F598|nr:hypothetical protein [Niallia taxi]
MTTNQSTAEVNQPQNTENGSSVASSQPTVKYPSADTLLAMIQSEYDIEASRKRDLETRTGVLIALLGALIGFYATAIDFSMFKKANSSIEYLCFTLVILIYIFPFVTFFLSMKKFIDVLQTKSYKRVGIGGVSEESGVKPNDELSMKLAESYRAVVMDNEKANDVKALQFKKGIILMYFSLIGVIVAFIIKQIVTLII